MDDDLADVQGRFMLELVARRTLYFTMGWPHRMLKVLINEDAAQQVMEELREDVAAHSALEGVPQSKHIRAMKERSLLSLTSTSSG